MSIKYTAQHLDKSLYWFREGNFIVFMLQLYSYMDWYQNY